MPGSFINPSIPLEFLAASADVMFGLRQRVFDCWLAIWHRVPTVDTTVKQVEMETSHHLSQHKVRARFSNHISENGEQRPPLFARRLMTPDAVLSGLVSVMPLQ
jgi:hypothetical protein